MEEVLRHLQYLTLVVGPDTELRTVLYKGATIIIIY